MQRLIISRESYALLADAATGSLSERNVRHLPHGVEIGLRPTVCRKFIKFLKAKQDPDLAVRMAVLGKARALH